MILLVLIALSLAAALAYFRLAERDRQGLVDAKVTAARMVADLFAVSLSAPLDFGDQDAIDAGMNHLRQNSDVVYAVIVPTAQSKTGTTLTPTVLYPEHAPLGGPAAGPPQGSAGKEATTYATADRVIAYRPVLNEQSELVGNAVVHFSLARENATYEAHRRQLLLIMVAFTVLLGGAILLGGRKFILGPIARLSAAAKQLELGKAARVEVRARDEVGRLGDAFNAMATAIEDREQRLAAARRRLQELFDNMRQAIVSFGPDGLVRDDSSRNAKTIFGPDLTGKPLRDLLYPGMPKYDIRLQSFDMWRESLFQADPGTLDEFIACGPTSVEMVGHDGDQLSLKLEFRPLLDPDGDQLNRVMLLATDETDRRRLEQTVKTQEKEHARQMLAMRRLVAGGAQLFASFVGMVTERLARARELVAGESEGSTVLPKKDIDELFRIAHTIRGEARVFDLGVLESEMRAMEVLLANRLPESASAGRERAEQTTQLIADVRQHVQKAEQAVERACAVFIEASPIGAAVLSQVTVQKSDVQTILELAGSRSDALGRAARRLASRPFGECVGRLSEAVTSWAESAGKKVQLAIDGRDHTVPPALARALPGVLAHIVRNAIAHGIESIDDRAAAGKDQIGVVHITCADATGEGGAEGREVVPIITIEDDGAGIDSAALVARARAMGIAIPADPQELVFENGISTASEVGDLSGRGIGLAAVRQELADLGFDIKVSAALGKGARFVIERMKTES